MGSRIMLSFRTLNATDERYRTTIQKLFQNGQA